MYNEALKDLVLSGVQWEINEYSNVPTYTTTGATNSKTISNELRTTTTIVPPIAPTQSISITTATAMAARPNDLDSLCRMIGEFNHPLRRGATNVVLPYIAPNPCGVVIITDMPGADDDASGKILSGTIGETIDKMLNAIELSRDSVSIVPMLFWRTPGGRTPTSEEIDLAQPFVERVLEMIKPTILLTLGTLPAITFGNVQLPKDHGNPVNTVYGAKLIPIYHPNYLALKPSAKRDVWNALQNLQILLKTPQK